MEVQFEDKQSEDNQILKLKLCSKVGEKDRCLTFKASDGKAKRAVVKFVKRYGTDVHHYMAACSLAPAMIGYERVDDRYSVVAMELIRDAGIDNNCCGALC